MALPGTPAGNEGQENQKKDEKKEYKERRESVDLTELCFPGLRKKCAPGMADQEGNILSLFENMGHMFGKFAVGLQASVRPSSAPAYSNISPTRVVNIYAYGDMLMTALPGGTTHLRNNHISRF